MTQLSRDIFWIGDRYCGLVKIGSGGMGEVWAGKALGDRGFERIIAIKRLHVDRRRHESHHRAIIDEAAVLQHLSASPNIVSIIDLREQDGQPALIMEYIDGPELRDVLKALELKNQRIPFPLVAYIVTEVSKGLSSAHQCRHPSTGEPLNIIHRDISPSNIMLSSTGAVKLTDFGIAKSEIQTAETHVGEIKGKFAYMAPEQARGLKLDFRTDYFALGLVFYECLFGSRAYVGDSDAKIITLAQEGKVAYPEPLPSWLERILNRLLASAVENRYSDLEQFRRELGQYAIDLGGIGTADDLRKYLEELHLPQLREAVERRVALEQAREMPSRSDDLATGAMQISKRPWFKRKVALIPLGLGVATTLGLGVFYLSTPLPKATIPSGAPPQQAQEVAEIVPAAAKGALTVETVPVGAMIDLRVDKRTMSSPSPASFSDLPLGMPIRISASHSDYAESNDEITLTADNATQTRSIQLRKKPSISVRFVATPPSLVTVPGKIRDQDAPSPSLTLPAGKYTVIFKNPLASGEARTTLNANEGGSFVCSANMHIDPGTRSPTGSPPTAQCSGKKN